MRIWVLLLMLTTGAAAELFPLHFARTEARDLASLDVVQVEKEVEVKHGSLREVISLLKILVPEATMELSGDDHLIIRGSQAAVEQALELLEILDSPPEKLTVELKVVLDKPEMKPYLGARWSGQAAVDEPPVVKHWEFDPPAQAGWIPGIGLAENPDFEKMTPWILSSLRVETQSGEDIRIADRGIGWDVTPNFKQDGYVVFKVLPELSDGVNSRRFATDVRVKLGETIVLGGLGRAEEVGLAGEGRILLMITVRSGW